MANSYTANAAKNTANKKRNLPMNWYFFIIWFQLFMTAFSDFYQAYLYLTGNYYARQGIDTAAFYQNFPLFRPVNIVLGLLSICVGVYALYVRFQMAAFKKDAWRKYLKVTLAGVVMTVAYIVSYVVVSAIYGDMMTAGEFVEYLPTIIGGIGIYFISESYFEKRDFMFVN